MLYRRISVVVCGIRLMNVGGTKQRWRAVSPESEPEAEMDYPQCPGWPMRDAPIWVNSITAALMALVLGFGVVVFLDWMTQNF
jgi:hypothetical protein